MNEAKAALLERIFPGEIAEGLDSYLEIIAEQADAPGACEHQQKAATFSRMVGFAIIHALNAADEPNAESRVRAESMKHAYPVDAHIYFC